jgi:hypothetical protein
LLEQPEQDEDCLVEEKGYLCKFQLHNKDLETKLLYQCCWKLERDHDPHATQGLNICFARFLGFEGVKP